MTYWRKFKWNKITSKNTNRVIRDTNGDKNSIAQSPKKQLCFYCRILLLALRIARICSTTLLWSHAVT